MTLSSPIRSTRQRPLLPASGPVRSVAPDAASMAICRQAFAISRTLHEAGADPVERKRRLLAGICEMVGARQAISAVTHTDLETGSHAIQSVVAIRMVSYEPTKSRDTSADVGNAKRSSDRRSRLPTAKAEVANSPITAVEVPAETAQTEADLGRCIDDFVWLDGLKLIGGVTFTRPVTAPRFSTRDRALIELIHKQFAWVYTHDRRLHELRTEMTETDQQVLQDLLAGCDASAIAKRWNMKSAEARTAIESLFDRLGVRSRDQLIAKWASPLVR